MDLGAGIDVGPYRLDSILGQGGMGVVYRATDTKLNRTVALKVLSSSLADAAARQRFQREAQTASSLSHPHIIVVHDAGEFDGRQYLVTELAAGGTLADWAERQTRTSREIVELLIGIADALATAHGAGILHRDIKPGNILLTKTGYAKLADFGLAKIPETPEDVTRAASLRTAVGAVVGTTAYMSPEQAAARRVDFRSDIFSFGIVLYELLAGRRPFSGESDVDLLHGSCMMRPAAGRYRPAPLKLLVEKTLEKDPADRYQTMREVVVDMRRLLRQSGESVQTPIAPARSSPRYLWQLAAAIVLLGLGAGVVLLVRGKTTAVTHFEYTPLTNFSDSVVAPALSPDGRMLAFIRGENTFDGPGEVYVKLLPDGEPAQITHDGLNKMGQLVFSPDGSRIVYSVGTIDSWIVPVLGGRAAPLLANASALSWLNPSADGQRRVMYSALTGEGIHMGIFSAAPNRTDERKIYLPADVNGMAHRSFASPDGRSVLLIEMDLTGWRPCRLVPADGSSPGTQFGPVPSQCTDAAWLPDGRGST